MKKYFGHTLLYLHETIALGSERAEGFTDNFTAVYQPMMEALGARLFSIWETTPYNGHWPQVTIIWELDAFADYARIGRAQAPGGSHRDSAAAWSEYLAAAGAAISTAWVQPQRGAHLGHLVGRGVLPEQDGHRVAHELEQHEGNEGHGDHDDHGLQEAAQYEGKHCCMSAVGRAMLHRPVELRQSAEQVFRPAVGLGDPEFS